MFTRQTFIDTNMSVSFLRDRMSVLDMHFPSAPTRWHISATRYQKSLEIRHVLVLNSRDLKGRAYAGKFSKPFGQNPDRL